MIALIKGLFPGTLLTFVVSAILGKNHSTGAYLDIHRVTLDTHSFYWSWPLFFAATILSWALFAMMPD